MVRGAFVLPSLVGLLSFSIGCSSDPRVLSLEIVTGHETDAMTVNPPVANVIVRGTTPEGDITEAQAAPGGDLDFGEIDGSLAYSFTVTGVDGAGAVVMRGRSLGGIVLDSIEADTFQLFAQRLGTWSRPPGKLANTHTRAPAVSVGERFLLMTGGDASEYAKETEEYDLFVWSGVRGTAFPFVAKTLMSNVSSVLALGSETGNEVTWFDANGFSTPALPEGLTSFGELAGGSVIVGPEERYFLVGATRATTPTDAVLDFANDGSIAVRRLTAKRAGAAATWLPDVGLVIAGGSAGASGVEVLGEDATQFAARDFPSDPVAGAGAVLTTLGAVALVGGVENGTGAKTRLLDPRCTSACEVKELDLATPGAALTRVSAYPLATGRVLAAGDESDPAGQTRTFLIDYVEPSVTELMLREPRLGATLVAAPNGTLALMGGVHPDGSPALTVEMYYPE